jgi:hypothetical protein
MSAGQETAVQAEPQTDGGNTRNRPRPGISMGRVLDSHIDINAPAQRVWEVLADFSGWGEWNPFIPSIEGELELGARLHLTVAPPDLKPMEFKPKVFVLRPGEEIVWGGSFLRWLFRGDHAISLEALPGGRTRFRQRERFRGPMVLLMGKMFEPTAEGYRQMNQALKERVEGRPGS